MLEQCLSPCGCPLMFSAGCPAERSQASRRHNLVAATVRARRRLTPRSWVLRARNLLCWPGTSQTRRPGWPPCMPWALTGWTSQTRRLGWPPCMPLPRLGQPVSAQVRLMVEAVTHPSVAGWRHSAWLGRASSIVTATGNLLADDPAAAVSCATGVSGHGDGDQRAAAMNHLGSVLEEWRALPGAVLRHAAEHRDRHHQRRPQRAAA